MYHALLCLSMMAPAQPPATGPPTARPCPCHEEMVCVKEPTVKKVTHIKFDSLCVPYCLPCRSILGTLCCKGDDALKCSKVREKHVLVVHKRVEEKCELKCVPKPAGACCDTCAPGAVVVPAAPVMIAPK